VVQFNRSLRPTTLEAGRFFPSEEQLWSNRLGRHAVRQQAQKSISYSFNNPGLWRTNRKVITSSSNGDVPNSSSFQKAGNPTSATTSQGFLDIGGIFTFLQFLGSVFTQALGLNTDGEVVGSYVDSGGVTHGFTYNINTKTYTSVDAVRS
jgi:hypothetical protein